MTQCDISDAGTHTATHCRVGLVLRLQNYSESRKHPYTYVNSAYLFDSSTFKSVNDGFKFVYFLRII